MLYDCHKHEQYLCEIKKRWKKKEKFLCGAWFDYARDTRLKEGNVVHFVIHYPPVEEIMVYVEHREVHLEGRWKKLMCYILWKCFVGDILDEPVAMFCLCYTKLLYHVTLVDVV